MVPGFQTAMITMTWPQYLRHECMVDGLTVRLAPADAELLLVLMLRYPGWVPVSELIEALWPEPDDEAEWARNAVKARVSRLRGAIGGCRVTSRWGWGYALIQAPGMRGLPHDPH